MAGGLQKKKRENLPSAPKALPGKKKKRAVKVPSLAKSYK